MWIDGKNKKKIKNNNDSMVYVMFIEKLILLCKWKYYSLLGAWIQAPLLPQQATKAVNCLLIPGERFLKILDSFCGFFNVCFAFVVVFFCVCVSFFTTVKVDCLLTLLLCEFFEVFLNSFLATVKEDQMLDHASLLFLFCFKAD